MCRAWGLRLSFVRVLIFLPWGPCRGHPVMDQLWGTMTSTFPFLSLSRLERITWKSWVYVCVQPRDIWGEPVLLRRSPPVTLAEGKGARRVRLTSIPQGGTCSQVWEGQSQYMIWRQEWSGNRRYEGESGGSRTVVRGLPHAAWEELGSLCSGRRGCSLYLSTFRLCRMLIQIL